MANSSILKPFILSFEGGFVNDPDDRGKQTNKGVTIATFRHTFGSDKTVTDLKNITDAEWDTVYQSLYWQQMRAGDIQDQSIANLMVDFAWASGVVRASKYLQKAVGTKQDGIVGARTLKAVNASDAKALFKTLHTQREAYIRSIAKGSQRKYLRGWLRRLDAIQYGSLQYDGKTVTF
jgi:lysozyme family protein